MKSKNSFYNISLIKSDLLRFWPMWTIIMLYSFLTHPLYTLINLAYTYSNSIYMSDFVKSGQEYIIENISNGAAISSIFVFAPIVAVLLFSYMNKTQTSYTLHSLPIKRSTMLYSHMLAAFIMIVAPYTISFILVAIISACYGLGMWLNIIAILLQIYIVIAFFLSLACLICMLSGNSIIGFGIYIVTNCVFYMALVFYLDLMGSSITRIVDRSILYHPVLKVLTPLYYMLGLTEELSLYSSANTGWGNYKPFDLSEVTHINLSNLGHIALYLIPAIAFIFLATLLYNKRKLETVGDSLCFKWSKPVFRTVFTYFAAMIFSAFLSAIFYTFTYSLKYISIVVSLCIFIIIGTALAFVICDMILEKTFFVWKKLNLPHLAIMIVFMTMLVLNYTKLPSTTSVASLDKVDYVSIFYRGNMYKYSGDSLDNSILDLEKALLHPNRSTILNNSTDALYEDSDTISFSYILKDGTRKDQIYFIPYDSETTTLLYNYFSDPERCISGLGLTKEYFDSLYLINVDHYYESDYDEYDNYEFRFSEDIDRIYDALIKDINEGNINFMGAMDQQPYDNYYSVNLLSEDGNKFYDNTAYLCFDEKATNTITAFGIK